MAGVWLKQTTIYLMTQTQFFKVSIAYNFDIMQITDMKYNKYFKISVIYLIFFCIIELPLCYMFLLCMLFYQCHLKNFSLIWNQLILIFMCFLFFFLYSISDGMNLLLIHFYFFKTIKKEKRACSPFDTQWKWGKTIAWKQGVVNPGASQVVLKVSYSYIWEKNRGEN